MTAVNDEGGQINIANDGNGEDTIPKTMQKYKQRNEPWMLVVDDNCKLSLLFSLLFCSSPSLSSPFSAFPRNRVALIL
jgi:hypothetical protein